jgi:hypothetical protein
VPDYLREMHNEWRRLLFYPNPEGPFYNYAKHHGWRDEDCGAVCQDVLLILRKAIERAIGETS